MNPALAIFLIAVLVGIFLMVWRSDPLAGLDFKSHEKQLDDYEWRK